MKRFCMALMALMTIGLTCMAQNWRQMMSRVEEHTIQSEVLGAERNYTVYLPARYDIDKEKTYPAKYMETILLPMISLVLSLHLTGMAGDMTSR